MCIRWIAEIIKSTLMCIHSCGRTVLVLLLRKQQSKVYQVLLDKGLDRRYASTDEYTPQHLHIFAGMGWSTAELP